MKQAYFIFLMLFGLVPAGFCSAPMKHFGTLAELYVANGVPESCAKEHPKDDEYPIMACPEIESHIVKTEIGGLPGFTIEKVVLEARVINSGCFDKFYEQENVFTMEQDGVLGMYTGKPSANIEHCMGHVARPLSLTLEGNFTAEENKLVHTHTLLRELGDKFLAVDFDSEYKCSGENCRVELKNVKVAAHLPGKQ